MRKNHLTFEDLVDIAVEDGLSESAILAHYYYLSDYPYVQSTNPPSLVDLVRSPRINEKAPPGFEGTVKAMKKHKKITNPWALAWWMKNKKFKSHK